MTAESYQARRSEIAGEIVDSMAARLRLPLRDHIREIVIVSPETIQRFSGSPSGRIYGYRHRMDDHIAARLMPGGSDPLIPGLAFAGAHSFAGDGMGPAILNGQTAAKAIYDQWEKSNRSFEEGLRQLEEYEYEN